MKIVKSEAPGQFFVVGMDVAKDQKLSLTERGMLLTLLSLPPDWDFTVEGVSKILPDGRDRIRTAMNNLKKYGYVMQVQGRREDGAFDSGHMEIYHKPFDVSGVDDKPPSVLPSSENPTSGKAIQVNNHISNNHKLNNYECVGTLEPSDYEKLCSLHEKVLVDYQIERIKAHHYIGYMNFDRIDHMCKEYETRKSVSPPKKKNSFHNFHERDYPPGYWEELERKLLAN